MSSLSGYLLLAVSTGIFAGVAAEAAHPRLKESVEWVTGLILILALVGPVLGLVVYMPSVEVPKLDTNLGEGDYVEVAVDAMERGIAEELADSFLLNLGEVEVECGEVDLNTMRCPSVMVALSCSPNKADFAAIRGHVLENYVTDGGSCEVIWVYE